MTRRSGDALSHVYFQTPAASSLTQISAAGFVIRTRPMNSSQRSWRRSRKSFLTYLHGGHETALRNDPGRRASFDHYLPKSFRIGG
jgi:hypothetical protein